MHLSAGDILFVSRSARRLFSDPVEIVSARRIGEIRPSLRRVAAAVDGGLFAAGFLAYESAPAFDPALKTHDIAFIPPLWFGLYREMKTAPVPDERVGTFDIGPWSPLVSADQYRCNIGIIRRLIEEGETYQVNYTFPLQADFRGDSLCWFRQLCAAQRADYSAYIDLGRYRILSASPELFFRLNGKVLETRPMKGTRPRGRWPEEDAQRSAELASSEKDRAENIMIVDLLRNDLGKISYPGSVRARDLYKVEQYPTVWQMTSTILSRTDSSVPEILAALFPCGSVTGAPKIRTMEIIRDIEPHPRGVYCGTIGWWAPNRLAEFSVAIRTATVDTESSRAHYHVGGGITTGSLPEDEYQECLTKAAVLNRIEPEYELLESILFDGRYFLLEQHMERLKQSADYFGFRINCASVESVLADKAKELLFGARSEKGPQKVRLLLKRNGSISVESAPVSTAKRIRLGFSAGPVNRHDIFLYHKTTHRSVYEQALASRPDCDDVLLWNEDGEITESTIANAVLELNGDFLTPPVSSGLLRGAYRQHLLERGELHERILTKEDVALADSIHLINSVRKWIEVEWVDPIIARTKPKV